MHESACAQPVLQGGSLHTHTCVHTPERIWGEAECVSAMYPVLRSRGGTTGENPRSVIPEVLHSPSYPHAAPPRARHRLPLQHARLPLTSGRAAYCPVTAPAHRLSSASRLSPEMQEIFPCSITPHPGPRPGARHGSLPALLTPLHLTPVFFCLLFSLSVTYGCFCSAPCRHRERAQLPLL